jgi:hypothetical protein
VCSSTGKGGSLGTFSTAGLGRNGNVGISARLAVEGLELLADLSLLPRREVGEAGVRLVAGSALPASWLEGGDRGVDSCVGHVGPSRGRCGFCAGDFDDAEVVHRGLVVGG